ncbi:GGDEF domain-containing protein [Thiomicrorhabdus immobilis]|uniref:diguanylate cyclase n=1 Tax=Thiomicrorhabdus immobilis TaxID=2791037 RepID=A0ABM7MDS4_9GAMM|nr:GGDEF domain-containing protein [Thiomicrorhabdus immobilis]BCN93553.1 GGDEF domain-containing protein [Thiomicrorhabdus immobilis]
MAYAPYAVMLIAGFISLWLNRLQPFLVLLSVFMVNVIFSFFAPSEQVSIAQSVLFTLLSFLLPLNLLLWSVLSEKGIQNTAFNNFVLAVFVAQGVLIYWVMRELNLQWIETIALPIFPGLDFYHLSFASTLGFLLAGFILSLKLNGQKQLRVFSHAGVFVLLLMAFALNQYLQVGVLAWVSSMVGLIVILSLVLDAHHIAYMDELTGIKGRRALNEFFMGLGKRYAIAMVDIDHFKNFNDTHGHDMGDQVLKMVALILDTVVGGKAYRYGGEEFTLVFPGKSAEQVTQELERLREEVANHVIYLNEAEVGSNKAKKASSKVVSITISLGVAEPDAQHTTPEQVMKFADEGLYKAKRLGRNKLVRSMGKSAKAAPKTRAKKSA